jgi:Tfp pilus assembly protein PilP
VDPALSEGQAIVRPDTPDLITPEEAERRYIATGIWQLAPQQPAVPAAAGDADVYQASIDPQVRTVDAVALPDIWVLHDSAPNETLNPTAAGTTFDTDERGLVRATPAGALTPEGITVYAGRPASVPAQLPTRRGDGLSPAELERLAQVRPRARPDDLQETTQRGQLGGRTLSELASIRPKARPSSITPQSAEPQEDAATPQAVAMSLRPKTRPKNFAQLVERTQKAETRVAAAAPSIPSSASVARQATVKNALNLKKLNLIGVNGKSGNRRALVRTQNGRYKTVKVGDRLDGGKVAAITETELRYTKNGKSVVLKMPRG